MGNSIKPETCPIANICAVTAEQAPPCGEDAAHFPPIITAEEMCPRALARKVETALEKTQDPEIVEQKSDHLVDAAWAEFEYGQTLPDSQDSTRHTAKAMEYADEAMVNPYGWFRNSISAAMLRIYGAALVKQKQGIAPSESEIATIRQGLGVVYDSLMAAPVHAPQNQHIVDAATAGQEHAPCLQEEGERGGLAAKLVGMMLAAREGIFLYPASAREGRGSGVHRWQNHDAYASVGGRKLPVKLRAQPKLEAGNRRPDKFIGYDPNIAYINVKALIGKAADALQRTNYARHSLLVRKYGQTPTVLDVGGMLRAELDGAKLDTVSQDLLNAVSASMGSRLTADIEGMVGQTAESTWEILPAKLANRPYTGKQESPARSALANRAVYAYLQDGNKIYPDPARLERLIAEMREVQDPYVMTICSGAYIDLARQQPNPMRARQMLDAAEALTASFAQKSWTEISPENVQYLYKLGLQNAYLDKYKKVISGEAPNLYDEMELYKKLLACGESSLLPAAEFDMQGIDDVRGAQFKLCMHILNTRRNLKHGQILQSMWPSLPREADPIDNKFDLRAGSDAVVMEGDAWNLAEARRVKFRSIDDTVVYDPDITVIFGREHLTTSDTAEVIRLALKELNDERSKKSRARANARLNEIERRFLLRLNVLNEGK